MNFLSDLYQKSLTKNEESRLFWENYLQNLKALDFTVYAEKLKVPALVPVGSRVFFRGELKHTNEVTVALGADYFVKCSLKQAEVLRQHRIKGAESKLQELHREWEYIQSQLSFSTENVFKEQGHEIFEEFTEEEDLKWRKKHRENVRQYKQRSKTETQEKLEEQVTDEELWFRLEELELKEELEEEMENMETLPKTHDRILHNKDKQTPLATYQEDFIEKTRKLDSDSIPETDSAKNNNISNRFQFSTENVFKEATPKNDSKLDLLEQVLEKQNELKEKLIDLRNRKSSPSQTVKDLISKIDEMEQLEELEDEMDRLDDVLQSEDVQETEEYEGDEVNKNNKSPAAEIKRSVSFADEDTSETLEIPFHHTETEPDKTPYSEEKGITKPSDIYGAFSNLFSETTSILKKSKYDRDLSPSGPRTEKRTKVDEFQEAAENRQRNRTISINDVVEKVDENDNKFEGSGKRPMSLFKKRRQQNLS